MDVNINKSILAAVTTRPDKITGTGIPVFICDSEEERDKVSFALSKITGGMIHDLENGVYIVVRH